ncbi:MAG: hypothetical protein ABWZ99_17460 [Ilumatobacteraceae bacterium]
MNTPIVTLDAADAIEIAEALQWLRDWFASDPELARSMRRFSLGLFTLEEISAELDQFTITLGHRP